MKILTVSERRKKLASARLTAKQALCLALYRFDGLTQPEIGRRLRISQRAVAYHIAAACRRLAKVGLRVEARRIEFRAILYPMDPYKIDRLGPRDVKAVW